MISAVELKRHIASASIFDIIIGKFHYKKKPYPVILFKMKKSTKVGFYGTILPLDQTVCLWVEGDKKSSLDIKEIT